MYKLLIALFIFLWSCDPVSNSSPATDTQTTSIDTVHKVVVIDTVTHTIDASVFKPIYSFRINNLNYIFQINKDSSYTLQEEGNKRYHAYKGRWQIQNSKLLLAHHNDTISVFNIQNDSLFLTVLKGENIGLLRPEFHENAEWEMSDKLTKGRILYAIGTEPFWSLEVDADSIRFNMADWKQPLTTKTPKVMAKADSIYLDINKQTHYRITIYNRFCSDGMSDRIYPAAVKIHRNNQTYSGCAILSNDMRKQF